MTQHDTPRQPYTGNLPAALIVAALGALILALSLLA